MKRSGQQVDTAVRAAGLEGTLPTRGQEFRQGAKAITPLVIGAIPFGMIFGAVAVTGGLSPAATVAMSAFVFAGAAQFVAAGMIAGGAATWLIIATTFIVNLRHALYASSLGPYLRGLPQRWLALLGFVLVDEVYLFAIRRYASPERSSFKHWYFFGAGSVIYVNWQLSTWIGVWAGRSIADPRAWGLDFALPVTFIGMLIPSITRRSVLWCVVAAGIMAVLLRGLPNQMGLVLATLSGIAAGVLTDARDEAMLTRESGHHDNEPVAPGQSATVPVNQTVAAQSATRSAQHNLEHTGD